MTPGRRLMVVLVALVALGGIASVSGLFSRPSPSVEMLPPEPFGSGETDSPAVVWAVGDGADGSDDARVVADRIAADRPDRFLYLGDVYDTGTPEEFRTHYDSVYGSLTDITAPTPGNHDWPAHRDGYDPYWSRHTGVPTPPWYAFRVGGWQVISLNSEAPHDRGSAQLRWLRAQVSRARGTCALAFWHRPLLSVGLHGDQPDVAPFWEALRGHASLVVNGHDHTMQRFRPLNGITEVVAGAGGAGLYELNDDQRPRFADNETYGALRMTLQPGRAELSFVSDEGEVLDRSRVTCEAAS